MRPVERGSAPREYSHYGDAIGDLEERLGCYCSYCERHFPSELAVEHVSPKSLDEEREKDWTNFLLACKSCNSVKKAKPTNDNDFVWPDKDNTLRAIGYQPGGLIGTADGLSSELKDKAVELIDLVGLDRHPGQPPEKQPAERDARFANRELVWELAIRKFAALTRNDTDEMRETITDVAKGYGFFGVWMSVFKEDSDMRRRFFEAFVGTAANCFDGNWDDLPRPGGHL
ncbi:MAG: HNH endonuclease [Roseibacillus sp.]